MWIFYDKHYRQETNWLLDKLVVLGIVVKGGADVMRHLWQFTRERSGGGKSNQPQRKSVPIGKATAAASAPKQPSLQVGIDQ
jgi:hypothetical protein